MNIIWTIHLFGAYLADLLYLRDHFSTTLTIQFFFPTKQKKNTHSKYHWTHNGLLIYSCRPTFPHQRFKGYHILNSNQLVGPMPSCNRDKSAVPASSYKSTGRSVTDHLIRVSYDFILLSISHHLIL